MGEWSEEGKILTVAVEVGSLGNEGEEPVLGYG